MLLTRLLNFLCRKRVFCRLCMNRGSEISPSEYIEVVAEILCINVEVCIRRLCDFFGPFWPEANLNICGNSIFSTLVWFVFELRIIGRLMKIAEIHNIYSSLIFFWNFIFVYIMTSSRIDFVMSVIFFSILFNGTMIIFM